MEYTNPILKGFNPDPSICYDGKYYYLVTSSFEYFPSLPIYKSANLISWERIGSVIEDESFINLKDITNSSGLFAPTIRYHEGVFFLVCTNITEGNFICHTKDPEKGWSKPLWIDAPRGIDPSLTFVNNTCYYQLAVFEEKNKIIQFEINPYNGEVLSDTKIINYGCGGRDAEAPHIFKKDEWYYLILAEGGTREGHMVTIQRSKNIWGPFKPCPNNPILSNRDVKLPLQSVGHADFIEDEYGEWWLVALATRPQKFFTLLGRESILLPVEWQDGWPIVNGTGNATVKISSDRKVLTKINKELNSQNLFNKRNIKTLSLPIEHLFDENDVILNNSEPTIKVPRNKPVSFLSISQPEFNMKFLTKLKPSELTEGRFGVMIYKDDEHYCKFGISKTNEDYGWFIEKKNTDLMIETKDNSLDKNFDYQLSLRADEDKYTFSLNNKEGTKIIEDSMSIRHFTNEVSLSKFTGVQIGIFVEAQPGKTRFYNTKATIL